MAWRIDEAVVRGELDNRVRGRVTGRIWFAGRPEPVALELEGNCWRDLAGRRLEFSNRDPKPGDLGNLAAVQRGVVGDITASRKVKVPDIPLDQIGEYYAAKKPFPWHWGNALYLEWFSESNGRVVIETASFELRVVGEPDWEMSEAGEEEQRKANGAALTGFMERLGGAAAASAEAYEDTEWNEKPFTEEQAEQRQAQSDRLLDRIEARLKKEGDGADYEKILPEEIERQRRERGEVDPTPEQRARNAEWIEEVKIPGASPGAFDKTSANLIEPHAIHTTSRSADQAEASFGVSDPQRMNRAGEEALNDPELAAEMETKHPLAERAHELTLQLMGESEAGNWVPENANDEHPAADLINAVMKAGAKLAGALNGEEWPPGVEVCASVIVRLKRARGYLDDALRAAESCGEENLIKPAFLGPTVVELVDLAHEADELIAELRAKLERGTD